MFTLARKKHSTIFVHSDLKCPFIKFSINSITGGSFNGLTVVKNNAASDDRDSLISKYCINVETCNDFGFSRNALKTSGFSLKDGLECFNTSSNTNVHSVSVRHMHISNFKCEIEFTREPDNNMYRQASFLLTSMSLSVLIFSKKFKRIFTFHIA